MNLKKERTNRYPGTVTAGRHVRGWLAFVLTIALSLQLLPVSARAAEDAPLNWQSLKSVESPLTQGKAATNTYIFEDLFGQLALFVGGEQRNAAGRRRGGKRALFYRWLHDHGRRKAVVRALAV